MAVDMYVVGVDAQQEVGSRSGPARRESGFQSHRQQKQRMARGDGPGEAVGAEESGGRRIAGAPVFPEPGGHRGEIGSGTGDGGLGGQDPGLQLAEFSLVEPLLGCQRICAFVGRLRTCHCAVVFGLQSAERGGPGSQQRGRDTFRNFRSFTDGSHADVPFVMSAGW
jgi:hypothetical protein